MQPASTEMATSVRTVVDRWKDAEGPLLPILNDIQDEFGYVRARRCPS